MRSRQNEQEQKVYQLTLRLLRIKSSALNLIKTRLLFVASRSILKRQIIIPAERFYRAKSHARPRACIKMCIFLFSWFYFDWIWTTWRFIIYRLVHNYWLIIIPNNLESRVFLLKLGEDGNQINRPFDTHFNWGDEYSLNLIHQEDFNLSSEILGDTLLGFSNLYLK